MVGIKVTDQNGQQCKITFAQLYERVAAGEVARSLVYGHPTVDVNILASAHDRQMIADVLMDARNDSGTHVLLVYVRDQDGNKHPGAITLTLVGARAWLRLALWQPRAVLEYFWPRISAALRPMRIQ